MDEDEDIRGYITRSSHYFVAGFEFKREPDGRVLIGIRGTEDGTYFERFRQIPSEEWDRIVEHVQT